MDGITSSESTDQARAGAAADWAICCSGGGIRSAAYCLGALQSLDQAGLVAKARWILGVSGGSYIASSRALVAHDLPPGTKPGAYAPAAMKGTSSDDLADFGREAFAALARLRGMECQASENYAEAFYGRKLVVR